jgi:hypothetical protein
MSHRTDQMRKRVTAREVTIQSAAAATAPKPLPAPVLTPALVPALVPAPKLEPVYNGVAPALLAYYAQTRDTFTIQSQVPLCDMTPKTGHFKDARLCPQIPIVWEVPDDSRKHQVQLQGMDVLYELRANVPFSLIDAAGGLDFSLQATRVNLFQYTLVFPDGLPMLCCINPLSVQLTRHRRGIPAHLVATGGVYCNDTREHLCKTPGPILVTIPSPLPGQTTAYAMIKDRRLTFLPDAPVVPGNPDLSLRMALCLTSTGR